MKPKANPLHGIAHPTPQFKAEALAMAREHLTRTMRQPHQEAASQDAPDASDAGGIVQPSDTQPMPYEWGCVLGTTLVLDAIPQILKAHEEGHSPAEPLGFMLKNAFAILEQTDTNLKENSQRGAAMGVIAAIADLAGNAILRGHAVPVLERERASVIRCIKESIEDDIQSFEQRALNTRGGAQ